MSQPLKLMLVAGARPNFMKVAPIIRAIERHNAALKASTVPALTTEPEAASSELPPPSSKPHSPCSMLHAPCPISYTLVHTGQHYDPAMSDVFFAELRIPKPDVNLEVGSGSHAVQTANIMTRFEPVCQQYKPDWVVVVGDVNSTLACTLVAAKLGIRVAHVEAGLRSFDRSMPEEINRVVTDALADLLLTPSEDANENLRREGVPDHKIRLVGNIMIDSLVANLQRAEQSDVLKRLGTEPARYVYVTLHRPSNVDDPACLKAIVQTLSDLASRCPIVFPLHPRTRNRLAQFGLSFPTNKGVHLLQPLGYHDSLALTKHARCVLTDSGGLQEESTFFRTPCLTLRPNTERPVTVTLGSNRLTTIQRLRADIDQVLRGPERIGQVPPCWDGQTAGRVLRALLEAS
jgi:UDP-N-acetylglucosamine 2-epimerase (non-hydrolysing)